MSGVIARRTGRLAGALLAGALVMASTGTAASAGPRAMGREGHTSSSSVPHNFVASSLAWSSVKEGWILGNAPCSKALTVSVAAEVAASGHRHQSGPTQSGTPPEMCTYTIGTTNGGTKWTYLGGVKAQITRYSQGEPIVGVTEVRAFSAKVGWVIGSDFFHTTNGARSWSKEVIPGGGRQVLDLASVSGKAFAIVSRCKWQVDCPSPLTLWRNTKPSANVWTKVPMNLPSNEGPQLDVSGKTVYVADPLKAFSGQPDLLYASTDGGASFHPRPVACDRSAHVGLVSVAASSSKDVAVLCESDAGMGNALKTAYRSTNTGKSYVSAGSLPAPGIQAEMAVSSTGDMVVGTWANGSYIDVNDTHHTKWTEVSANFDPGLNDLEFVSASEAWTVYGGADTGADVGELFVTHDGGLHWSEAGY